MTNAIQLDAEQNEALRLEAMRDHDAMVERFTRRLMKEERKHSKVQKRLREVYKDLEENESLRAEVKRLQSVEEQYRLLLEEVNTLRDEVTILSKRDVVWVPTDDELGGSKTLYRGYNIYDYPNGYGTGISLWVCVLNGKQVSESRYDASKENGRCLAIAHVDSLLHNKKVSEGNE